LRINQRTVPPNAAIYAKICIGGSFCLYGRTFTAGKYAKKIPYHIYRNSKGDIVGRDGGFYDWNPSPSEPGTGYWTGLGGWVLPGMKIGVFPIDEHYVLVIYGEAHWLKEFKPGDHVVLTVEPKIAFDDETADYYQLVDSVMVALEGSTTVIPYDIIVIPYEQPDETIMTDDYSYNPTSRVLSVWGDGTLAKNTFTSLGHGISSKVLYVNIGPGVTSIAEDTFARFTSLKYAYYVGSASEWNEIEIADGNEKLKNALAACQTYRFSFPSKDDNADQSYPVSYEDELFSKNSSVFSKELAQFALAMELSAWPSNNTTYYYNENGNIGRESNIQTMFNMFGFDRNLYVNYSVPLSDSSDKAAYAIGTRQMGDQNLVAVMVRGGGYGNEWASNFNVGSGPYHTGFNTSAEAIYGRLSAYLKENGLDNANTKILIAGYDLCQAPMVV